MGRAAVVALVLLAACSAEPSCEPSACERVTVLVEQQGARLEIDAEVADSPGERVRGLRGRAELAPDQGMLFLFEDVRARTFTMEGVLIPLDLLVIRGGRVVELIEMVPCTGAGVACQYPTAAAEATLELAGGTARAAGIGVGAVVEAAGLL